MFLFLQSRLATLSSRPRVCRKPLWQSTKTDSKRDLSQFGLPSSSVFSSFNSTAPRQAMPLEPLTSKLKRKTQDFRSAESFPGHSLSDRRAKASSASFPSALKMTVNAPAGQLATRSPRQVVLRSPSSPLSPMSQLPYFAECESGRVAQ